MSVNAPVLHLVCGKIAAGKSTLITALANQPNTIVVREDEWLARLYPDTMNSLADYARNSKRLREAMTAHLIAVLQGGLSVALDFPANTPGQRAWMRQLFERAGCGHQLHFLDVSDDLCKSRLHLRNDSGTHEYTVSDEDFALFSSYFVPPSDDEGFNVILHQP